MSRLIVPKVGKTNLLPWSKMFKVPVIQEEVEHYYLMQDRIYHGFDHLKSMFKILHDMKIDYDPNLDLAILFHDIILDGGEHQEFRSAVRVLEMIREEAPDLDWNGDIPSEALVWGQVISPGKVAELIISTIEHKTKGVEDIRLIELDLHGFADDTVAMADLNKLRKELAIRFPKSTEIEIYQAIHRNVTRIRGVLEENRTNVLNTIRDGMKTVLRTIELKIEELERKQENKSSIILTSV